MPPMKLGLSRPTASLGLLRCLQLAAASSSSSSVLDAIVSSSSSELDTGSAPSDHEKQDASTKTLESRLLDKKKAILALVADERFKINGPNMRKHVAALHKGFFDALQESSLYVFLDSEAKTATYAMSCKRFKKSHPSLGEESRIRILDMTPAGFERRCDKWCSKRIMLYQYKIEKYSSEKRSLVRQIEEWEREHPADKKGAPESRRRLEALEASLEECDRRCEKYSATELERCRGYCERVKSLSRRLLGRKSIFALYRSYLAAQRSLGHAKSSKRSTAPESTLTTSSSLELDYEGCMICIGPFKPDNEKICCVNGCKFHERCIHRWSKLRGGTCPACREEHPFVGDQQSTLAQYEAKCMDYLFNLYSDLDHLYNPDGDLDFEERYTRDGSPIDREYPENSFLESMCGAVRRCIQNLKSHPSYATIFNNPGSSAYRRFYIPQNIVGYLEGTGRRDPRSRGFAKHKAVLTKYMLDYKKQLETLPYLELEDELVFLDHDIISTIHSMLNALCALDSVLEYLYTELHEIKDPAERRQAIMDNPHAYPALHGLMSRRPNYSFDDISRSLMLVAWGTKLEPRIRSQHWLLKTCDVFSKMISEA